MFRGFIDKFATIIHPDGSKELESSIVSIWGGMNWASQIVFQALSPFVVDRLGRKASMYALLTFMLLVSRSRSRAQQFRAYMTGHYHPDCLQGLERYRRRQSIRRRGLRSIWTSGCHLHVRDQCRTAISRSLSWHVFDVIRPRPIHQLDRPSNLEHDYSGQIPSCLLF